MLESMTDHIRRMVRVELQRRGLTQQTLAESMGRKRQQINNALTGRAVEIPDLWQDIFEKFGWELRVFDKDGNEVR